MLRKFLVFALLALLAMVQFSGTSLLVRAEDDILPDVAEGDEDLDGVVENEETLSADDNQGGNLESTANSETEAEKEDDDEDKPLKPSSDAETNLLFIQPTGTDFPAGLTVKFLVGFSNKGDKDFVVDTMDAAFRYPQDYSFYIQNFTNYRYYQTVEPQREATFEYAFTPSESFSGRSFGLTINLNYRDSEGNLFQDAIFNTTVSVTEPDEGLDGETFFLYLFLFAIAVLVIFGAHQLLSQFGKKHLSSKSKSQAQPTVEMGTQNNKTDVDYDWIPKEVLNPPVSRSPKTRTSPRQRTTRRGTADD